MAGRLLCGLLQVENGKTSRFKEGCRRSAHDTVRLTTRENIAIGCYPATRAATYLGYPSNGFAPALGEARWAQE
jgi:hypothetical protein